MHWAAAAAESNRQGPVAPAAEAVGGRGAAAAGQTPPPAATAPPAAALHAAAAASAATAAAQLTAHCSKSSCLRAAYRLCARARRVHCTSCNATLHPSRCTQLRRLDIQHPKDHAAANWKPQAQPCTVEEQLLAQPSMPSTYKERKPKEAGLLGPKWLRKRFAHRNTDSKVRPRGTWNYYIPWEF